MRRFECVADGSAKFWEIEINGSGHTVRFGKLGTNGQTRAKSFASRDLAHADAEKLIREKTSKGYVEVHGAPTGGEEHGDEALAKALADIKEWLADNGAAEIVDNLADGATDSAITACEARIGARFPAGLRQLYLLHDGQKDRDAYPFFERFVFVDLAYGLLLHEEMLGIYFGASSNEAQIDGKAPPDVNRAKMSPNPEQPLSEAEYTTRWWPLASGPSLDYRAVNLDTGRVFELFRDTPAFALLANDVTELFAGYADQMWNDGYEVAGDTEQDGVTSEGFISMKKHLQSTT